MIGGCSIHTFILLEHDDHDYQICKNVSIERTHTHTHTYQTQAQGNARMVHPLPPFFQDTAAWHRADVGQQAALTIAQVEEYHTTLLHRLDALGTMAVGGPLGGGAGSANAVAWYHGALQHVHELQEVLDAAMQQAYCWYNGTEPVQVLIVMCIVCIVVVRE